MKKLILSLCMVFVTMIVSAQMMSEKIFDFYSSLDLLDTETREKKLQAAIKNNPKEPWYFLIRAEFSMIMGENDRAENDYVSALAINPSFSATNGLYARFLYTNNPTPERLSKALELIEKAIKLDPSEQYYLLDKGSIYLEMNQFDKAMEAADLVLKKFTDFEADAIELKIKALHGAGDKEKLHRFFKQTPAIMEIFFVNVDFVLLVGSIYEEIKMYDNACGVYFSFADFLTEMEDAIPVELASKLQRCE